jgi:hypothetical protein
MNVLRDLTATASEEPSRKLLMGMAIANEPVPGFMEQTRFGVSGVLLIAGGAQMLFPLEELWRLAARIDDRFSAAKNAGGPNSLTQVLPMKVDGRLSRN